MKYKAVSENHKISYSVIYHHFALQNWIERQIHQELAA